MFNLSELVEQNSHKLVVKSIDFAPIGLGTPRPVPPTHLKMESV